MNQLGKDCFKTMISLTTREKKSSLVQCFSVLSLTISPLYQNGTEMPVTSVQKDDIPSQEDVDLWLYRAEFTCLALVQGSPF